MPHVPTRFVLVASFAVTSLAATLLAAEGSIPVRAGDGIRGTLIRCLDRHVFETELVRGERFHVRVDLADASMAPALTIQTADGLDVSGNARIRSSGGVIEAGPFRVPQSGVYRVALMSSSAHAVRYEMSTTVARRHARTRRVATNGRTTTALAAAGSTLSLRVKEGAIPRVAVAFPGESPRELAAGDPMLAALLSYGIAAPSSGSYEFSVLDGTHLRLVVTPPATVARTVADFPPLPGDGTVTNWYPAAGWVASPSAPPSPSGHAPSTGTPPVIPPAPGTWAASLVVMTAPPAAAPIAADAADASRWLGPSAGVGMPLSGAPSLAEVLAFGHIEETATGTHYVVTVPRPVLGSVTYRVSFSVDGRAAAAPASFAGRVTMTWSVASSAVPMHYGAWTMTIDPVRGIGVLDGSELVTDAAARTVSASARGFALAAGAAHWPSGSLSWGFSDPRNQTTLSRRETYDGTANVLVSAGAASGAAGSGTVVTLPR